MMKRLIAPSVLAFFLFGCASTPAYAQQQPVQWRYSFDANRIAVASYPSTVNVSGDVTLGETSGASTGQVTVNGSTPGKKAIAINTYALLQPAANYSTVGMQFNALESFQSFGDLNSHFGFVVNGGRSTDQSVTTGSWNLFRAGYTGYGGATANSYVTAAQFIVEPAVSVNNKFGNFTGANPECIIRAGLSPASCVGEEVNILTEVAPSNIRQAIRVADVGSLPGTFGVNTDSAIGITKGTGIGWRNGLLFGDETVAGSFPVPPGGTAIKAIASANALQSFIDFSNISGAPTSAALSLPANIRLMCIGVVNACGGGSIVSVSSANGGQIVYGSDVITFNWAGQAFAVESNGNATIGNLLKLTPKTFAALAACNAGNHGAVAAVSDSNSAVFNAVMAGGGANRVLAYCNGTNWTVH